MKKRSHDSFWFKRNYRGSFVWFALFMWFIRLRRLSIFRETNHPHISMVASSNSRGLVNCADAFFGGIGWKAARTARMVGLSCLGEVADQPRNPWIPQPVLTAWDEPFKTGRVGGSKFFDHGTGVKLLQKSMCAYYGLWTRMTLRSTYSS